MALVSINPSTGKKIQSYAELAEEEVKIILNNVHTAKDKWAFSDLSLRLNCVSEMIGVLKDNKREFSHIITKEMGKPVSQSVAEIDKCIFLCKYYFENAEGILADRLIKIDEMQCTISLQPIGIVLGIMPWNFPFWQVYRFAIPTILAGNACLLKHAPNVQGCAEVIESAFVEAGFPVNIFRNIPIAVENVSKVIGDSRVSAVTMTGSTKAGRSVAKTAGQNLKKTVLELGGSDPYIILDDADLDKTVNSCIDGRILNSGQSCISAKRIIATENTYDLVLEKLENNLFSKIMGDPFDNVDIGPMVSLKARDEVHNQVTRSIDAGAILVMGGFIPDMPGAYYPITLLADVEVGMATFEEEIFGPVFSLTKANDNHHAIELANQTPFGLGAAVFTRNTEEGVNIAKTRIDAGSCFVNDFVKSDPRLPFGGIKESGYGRELSSFGMMEFVNVKTIVASDA